MSEGNRHRKSIRRPLSTLLGVSTAVLACLAIATGAGAQEGPPDLNALEKAFKDYLESIREMQKSFVASDTFLLDDAHTVGAYDLITAFVQSSMRANLSSSGTGRRGYPRMAGFDDPDTRIGVDNPDTQYMAALVNNSDEQGIWRVTGNRSNTADFILTTFDTSAGTGGGPTLEDEDMVIAPDGSYEVYASSPGVRDPAWDNYLELPQSEILQIARRHSSCDWTDEFPGEVHIERVGSEGVPSAPLDPNVMTQQIVDGTSVNEIQAPFWPAFIDTVKQIPVNTATPWQPTGGLGITTQLNMLMWYQLEDDEALIIRFPDEEVAAYYGFQLSNFWGSSRDWANRHVSMSWGLGGTCQAEMSQPTFHPAQQKILAEGGPFCGQQDAYFIVVSKQDPGVRNWVETAEMKEGLLAARLQSVPGSEFPDVVGFSCMLPVALPPVSVAAVKGVLQQLGASFTPYDANDRAEQLEVRQNFVRKKYVFW